MGGRFVEEQGECVACYSCTDDEDVLCRVILLRRHVLRGRGGKAGRIWAIIYIQRRIAVIRRIWPLVEIETKVKAMRRRSTSHTRVHRQTAPKFPILLSGSF